jgi:hypothetical protein
LIVVCDTAPAADTGCHAWRNPRAEGAPPCAPLALTQQAAVRTGAYSALHDDPENRMHALNDLFTTDVGLMTVVGLGFMLGMAVFFIRYFFKHIREDGEAAARASQR